MSYQAVSWALYDAPRLYTDGGLVDTTAHGVLVVLAEHANEAGGNARPGPLRIRYATGYDVRTIDRALRRLEQGGLIQPQGVAHTGTVRYQLSMHLRRPESDWDDMRAEADAIREAESAKRKARRHRQQSIHRDDVRHAESRTSGTENAGVRHAESRMSGTQRPPNHPYEPPVEPPTETTPGGTLPPDPLGPAGPAGQRTENQNSISEIQDEQGDQQGDHRPRARAHTPAREDTTHPTTDLAPVIPLRSNPESRVDNHDSTPSVTTPPAQVHFLPPATPSVHNLGANRCPHGRSTRRNRHGEHRCPDCRNASVTTPPADEPVTTPALTPEQEAAAIATAAAALTPPGCPTHGTRFAAGNRPDGQPACPLCRALSRKDPST